MEYNKTKRVMEKVTGIIGIVVAAFYILFTLFFIIEAFQYFAGEYDYYYYDFYTERSYYYDCSDEGVPFLIGGLLLLPVSILTLVFSIKLVKSPYSPNGEIKNRQASRIWILVLSALTFNFVMLGLTIAILCLKDLRDATDTVPVQPVNMVNTQAARVAPKPVAPNQNEYYEFYEKIQEIKKLKSLGIIDDLAFKKAITKIVTDLVKE